MQGKRDELKGFVGAVQVTCPSCGTVGDAVIDEKTLRSLWGRYAGSKRSVRRGGRPKAQKGAKRGDVS